MVLWKAALTASSLVLLSVLVTAQQTTTTTNNDDSLGTLLDGGIVTRTNVQEYADLSLDLRDMRNYRQDWERIKGLYEEGFNAERLPGRRFTLKYLSDYWSQDGAVWTPNYIYHIYGLSAFSSTFNSDLNNKMNAARHYQSEYIDQIIKGNKPDLTPDAILALSMWMYGTHILYQAVDLCQERSDADNPKVISDRGLKGGGFDEFIALWIGRDQTPGSNNGHGLYAWTQRAGDLFGTNNPEAPVNTKIKILYQEGATALSLPGACSRENDRTVRQLWNVATQIITEMMKPMFQWFLHSVHYEYGPQASMYAKALLPQISRCRPSLYKRLKERLDRDEIDFGEKEEIIRDVQEAYACFGLSCKDIQGSSGGSIMECKSESASDEKPPSLAGYRASSAVAPLSRIDLDIRQIRILSSVEAFVFADYSFAFGANVPKPRDSENDPFELASLSDWAVSATRKEADPTYSYFIGYYNHKHYANITVGEVLYGHGTWGTRNAAQRTEAIVLTSAFQIVYLETIRHLNNAVKQCGDVDPVLGYVGNSAVDRHPLDNAAALLIGSLEGPDLGGSVDMEDGELVWSLGKRRAFVFHRENDLRRAIVNDELVDLFYSAYGEMDASACTALQRTVNRIQLLMQVGIIQSVLLAAVRSQDLDASADDISLVQGEVFAKSLLPIIAFSDADTAQFIHENMVIQEGVDTVRDGAQAVADGFGYYMKNGAGLPCRYLGWTGDVKPCEKYPDETLSVSDSRRTLFAWLVATSWLSITILLL